MSERRIIERATQKTTTSTRSVKLPGKQATYTDKKPLEIARELRAQSSLGRREAKLAALERKVNG